MCFKCHRPDPATDPVHVKKGTRYKCIIDTWSQGQTPTGDGGDGTRWDTDLVYNSVSVTPQLMEPMPCERSSNYECTFSTAIDAIL